MPQIKFELAKEAEAEFYDIVDYYKQFDRNLSQDFIKEFEVAVRYLLTFPTAGHPYRLQTKRIFLSRFPYAIVYKIYSDKKIVVFAVMHTKRDPEYWEKRLK